MQGVPVHSLLSTAPLILKRQPNGDMTGPASGQKPMIREGSHFTLHLLDSLKRSMGSVHRKKLSAGNVSHAAGRLTDWQMATNP